MEKLSRHEIANCLSVFLRNDRNNPFFQDSTYNRVQEASNNFLNIDNTEREKFCDAGFVGQVSMLLKKVNTEQ